MTSDCLFGFVLYDQKGRPSVRLGTRTARTRSWPHLLRCVKAPQGSLVAVRYPNAKSSRQQLLCNCRPACGEDRAFEDDGKARVWFEPLDCGEQECGDEDDRRSIKKLARRSHIPKAHYTTPRKIETMPEQSRPILATGRSSIRCVTPSWHQLGSKAYSGTDPAMF